MSTPACWESKAAWTGEDDEEGLVCLADEHHDGDHVWVPNLAAAEVIAHRRDGAARDTVKLWARTLLRSTCVGLVAGLCFTAGTVNGDDGTIEAAGQAAIVIAGLIGGALAVEDLLFGRSAQGGRR